MRVIAVVKSDCAKKAQLPVGSEYTITRIEVGPNTTTISINTGGNKTTKYNSALFEYYLVLEETPQHAEKRVPIDVSDLYSVRYAYGRSRIVTYSETMPKITAKRATLPA